MNFKTKTYSLLISFCLFTVSAFSQEIQAVWELSKNQNVLTTGAIKASEQKLSNLKVSGYISTGAQRTLPHDLHWPAEKSINKERFLEYTVTSETNAALKIQAIKLALSFNSSSAAMAEIAWSVDGINFTTLDSDQKLLSGSAPKEYEFDNLNIAVPKSKTFYLRVYPWTTNALNSKYLVSKEIIIKGSTSKD